MAGPLSSFPYSPNLVAIYCCAFMKVYGIDGQEMADLMLFICQGFGSGCLDTGGNAVLLQTWAGRDSGPYMHALHFTFGLGAFLGPLVARPFLITQEEVEDKLIEMEAANDTLDGISEEDTRLPHPLAAAGGPGDGDPTGVGSVWTIRALYPLIGAYSLVSSLALLCYFVKDLRRKREAANVSDKEEGKVEGQDLPLKLKVALVSIMSVMFFVYVGMEVAFGTFISVFAVESDLGFTRPQGDNIRNSWPLLASDI